MVQREQPITTAEAFDTYALLPENRERSLEFIAGRVVEVVSNNASSVSAANIGAELRMFIKSKGLGYVTGADGGYKVGNERYIPDAAFISKAKLPQPSPQAYYDQPPDIAVEVLSPSNAEGDIRLKIVNYLRAGTLLWLIDPTAQTIEVYAPDAAPKKLTIDDTLGGGTVLPGFAVPVRDIFEA